MGGPVRATPAAGNPYNYSDSVQLSVTARRAAANGEPPLTGAQETVATGTIDLLA